MEKPKNPNDHKKVTPDTSGDNRNDDKKFTSYDTSNTETSSPQKVRETRESGKQHARDKQAKGEH